MAVELIVRRWGNSFGVVLPKELLRQKKIRPNDKVLIELIKPADLSDVFGTLKTKMSGQKFKNLVRKGWEP
ncbi:MAG TPA: AbrB/MazE/SpoVT family DNA-binding domain-containing protein [Candidatus Nanoarchaeia archaeon]|nr:AbrB/MazE/SpoVT family DNA-binding domain-containing protein [Candidatus Nanoarchaeia archaeon]